MPNNNNHEEEEKLNIQKQEGDSEQLNTPEVPKENPEKIAEEEIIEKIDERLETLEETGKRFQDEAERSPILAPEEKAEAETTVKETREEGQKTAQAAKTKIQETQEEAAAETITDIPKRIAEIEEELQKEQQKEQSEKRPIQANALKAEKEYLERQLSIQEDEKRIEKIKGEIGKKSGITDKIADRFVGGTIKEMERKKQIKENEQKIYEIRKEIADVSSKIRNEEINEEKGEEQITKLRNERKDLETAINQTESAKTRLEKIEDVLTNKELGKQFLKTTAGAIASNVGVKSFYDVPAYFKQRFMVKGMFGKGKGMSGSVEELLGASWERQKEGGETKGYGEVQKALDDLNKRIKQTKEGSEKGSEQRNKLAQILKENRLREKTEKEEREKEIKTILDDYTTTKITGIQAAKESLNTFLMASGAYALRGVSYGLMDGIGRYQNLQKEGKKQGKKVKVFKDVIVKSIENTFKEAVFIDDKSKETTKLQKGLTAIKAWGKIARYAGIGAMMGLHPQAGGDAIDNALDALSGKATLGDVANNFKDNTERIALVYGKAIKSLAQPLGLLTGEAQAQTMPVATAITDSKGDMIIYKQQLSPQSQIIPQGLTEPKIDYQHGHSIWEEAHNRLLKLNEFRQLGRPIKELVDFKTSEALQTYNIDRVENLITQNPSKYGLPENIDFTKMSDKQIANINWEQAFKDAFGEKPVLTSQLTSSQIENIVKNNESLRTYFQTHSNIPRTQENIAAILKGRVLPGAEEKITGAPTKQIPPQAPEELPQKPRILIPRKSMPTEEGTTLTPSKLAETPYTEEKALEETWQKIKQEKTAKNIEPLTSSPHPYNPIHPEEVIVPLSKEPVSQETAKAWDEMEKETRKMQQELQSQGQETTPPAETIPEAIIIDEKKYLEIISQEVADYLKIHSAELPPDIKKGQALAETIKSIDEQVKTVQADIKATAVNPAFLTKDKTNANLFLIQEIENKLTGQKPGQELDQEATRHLKLVINEGLTKDFNIPPEKLTNWPELQKIARQNPEGWERNQLLQYKMLLLQKRTIQDYLNDFLNLSSKVKSFKGILSPDQDAVGAGFDEKETPPFPPGG